ncbi:mannose-ethanolamine phosphotransferase LAS21 [Aspergillus candidus]|uniref:GPI ethanolamine phosphate transferase 2 n=1 Tax=Aspergillus candidus TaxID=41067 RepID=A0A2I2F1K3_ASPCN|nr:alkaline phosphatase-like protein [Aspergillus candidus]PLB34497.1 alkaline phosphatase-like protein [Aspergillus candidus]
MHLNPGSWAILIANILIPIAILCFSSGFFPYKPLLPGFAIFETDDEEIRPPVIFDKVIFMVVDALRSDFVYSNNSGFLFTQSLIRHGNALPFTAYASSPTVTMPRLKAMTTGSVPSFLDVILNIAESDTSSTLAHQDTWLAQLKRRGDRLVMYGDDTWLKLFPGMFDRADGTSSFFVSDFTEVDNNVTRHIGDELLQDDWSAFIIHYLGLDHIGHKSGPQSSYMIPKQHEMDSVVSQVYLALEEEKHLESTLFVLCGDHGMNDAGNHGGSSVGETSPALLFISPKFQPKGAHGQSPIEPIHDLQYYQTVDQPDLTPTLASLLGLPIPLNSLGVVIPELLMMWDHGHERTKILLDNARQLLKTVRGSFPRYEFDPNKVTADCDSGHADGIEAVQCAWFRVHDLLHKSDGLHNNDIHLNLESTLLSFLRLAQRLMSSAASDYDVKYLYLGIGITSLAVFLSVPAMHGLLSTSRPSIMFLVMSVLSYNALMFASSYVEEEQQFWYWLLTGWMCYLHIKSLSHQHTSFFGKTGPRWSFSSVLARLGLAGLAASHRLVRRWNQTGQKFAAEPDISRDFLRSHQDILWFLIILAYAVTGKRLISNLPKNVLWYVVGPSITLAAFLYKVVFVGSESPELLTDSILEPFAANIGEIPLIPHARFVLCGLLLLMLYSICTMVVPQTLHRQNSATPTRVFHESLTLFLMTQSKATNIPIFLVLRLQANILSSINLTATELTITSLIMQHVTFFAFGGSNSISSVDLSNAYNGIGSYNVILVGILMFIGNWAGPIWWVSASRLLRGSHNSQRWNKRAHITVLTFYATTTLVSVMVSCTVLRAHLFIWTVFSPKYLYTMVWILINYFGVNILGNAELPVLKSP